MANPYVVTTEGLMNDWSDYSDSWLLQPMPGALPVSMVFRDGVWADSGECCGVGNLAVLRRTSATGFLFLVLLSFCFRFRFLTRFDQRPVAVCMDTSLPPCGGLRDRPPPLGAQRIVDRLIACNYRSLTPFHQVALFARGTSWGNGRS